MTRIQQVFSRGRKAFIPYVTAGFPSVEETPKILRLLAENGADIIELGYPFSDPTADGPVIQSSSKAALEGGFRRDDYFRILEEFRREDTSTPVIVFSYFNPIFHLGVETFVARAKAAGADGMLVVDVPFEEQEELRPALAQHGLHLIELIAPTTPPERARRILSRASGFVYQIARRGVTGMRSSLAVDAADRVAHTRSCCNLPVALGFGVSSPEQAAAIAGYADAVVVGSALVKAIADSQPDYQGDFAQLTRALADAVHQAD